MTTENIRWKIGIMSLRQREPELIALLHGMNLKITELENRQQELEKDVAELHTKLGERP